MTPIPKTRARQCILATARRANARHWFAGMHYAVNDDPILSANPVGSAAPVRTIARDGGLGS